MRIYITPQNSHAVFCPSKQRSFELFMSLNRDKEFVWHCPVCGQNLCRSIHEQTTLTKRRTSANISLITRAKTGLVNECSHLRVWMQYGSRWFSLGSHATTWNGAVPKSIMAPTQGAKPVRRWQLPRPLAPLSCALFEGGNNLKASI